MLVRDMLGLSEEESDETVRRCYVCMLEAYRIALHAGSDLPQEARNALEESFRRLDEKQQEVPAFLTPVSVQTEYMDDTLYAVLHTLSYSSDISGCRRAVSEVGSYLEKHPGSVMGQTLLEIIREQMA